MLCACCPGLRPDQIDGVGSYLTRLFYLGIPLGLGLCQAPALRHFLYRRQAAANVCFPTGFKPRAPATKAPSRYAITKGNVPTRLVVAFLALGATVKAVQLAVKVDDVWWLQPCGQHGVFELYIRCINVLLRGRRPRATEDI